MATAYTSKPIGRARVIVDAASSVVAFHAGGQFVLRAAMEGTEAFARAAARWGCANDDVLRDVAFYNRLNASL